MNSSRRVPPVWLMGLSNTTLGFSTGMVFFVLPQLMAAEHIPELKIAAITAVAMSPNFWAVVLNVATIGGTGESAMLGAQVVQTALASTQARRQEVKNKRLEVAKRAVIDWKNDPSRNWKELVAKRVSGCSRDPVTIKWVIQPGRPQQNGRHERMHRTLKEDTAKPSARTVTAQQKKLDHFPPCLQP